MSAITSKSSGVSRKRQRKLTEKSSAAETHLEELLFGKDIIANNSCNNDNEVDNVEFVIDRVPASKPAWRDSDDEFIHIDVSTAESRLRKLKSKTEGSNITGAQMSSLFRDRFQTEQLEWAQLNTSGDFDDDAILRQSAALLQPRQGAFVDTGLRSSVRDRLYAAAPLRAGILSIKRVMDANAASPSDKAVTAVQFHASSGWMLAASLDRSLRFFRVDGELNEKQLSVSFPDMPIRSASFLGDGSQVVLSGRTPFFYCYDAASGAVQKVTALMKRGLKSHESMAVSPEGSRLAFLGAGGYVHVCNGSSKTWISDIKMNGAARSLCFLNESTLLTSGLDAEVYVWDLRYAGRCVSRFKHEDGSCSSSLAASPRGQYVAVGAESGVTTVFALPSPATSTPPTPLKSIMNLTHEVTTLAFHPSAQLLAVASDQHNDQIKLVHLPTCSVFSNWPTERTPARRVKCVDFSPSGAYVAFGNNRGRVLLYSLPDFACS